MTTTATPNRVEHQLTDKGYVPVYTTAVVEQPWSAYSSTDHQVWETLFKRQREVLVGRASDEFLRTQEAMGMSPDRIPKFTGATTVGDSMIYDDGSNVGIGAAPTDGYRLSIQTKATNFADGIQIHHLTDGEKWQIGVLGPGTTNPGALSIQNNPTGGNRLAISTDGKIGICTVTPTEAVTYCRLMPLE